MDAGGIRGSSMAFRISVGTRTPDENSEKMDNIYTSRFKRNETAGENEKMRAVTFDVVH